MNYENRYALALNPLKRKMLNRVGQTNNIHSRLKSIKK